MGSSLGDAVIRDAEVDDAPVLAQAERDIAQVPGRLASQPEELEDRAFREKITRLNQHESGKYLVIEFDGQLVGHGLLDPLQLAVTAHVVTLSMAIHEGFQGMGFGKKLLSHLVAWSISHERVEKIELNVRSSNLAAISLYMALGFQEEGRKLKRLKYGPGQYLDDVQMGCWVGPI